ncbi:hypothetical protein U9M48_027665 [Paspalum notatum var. saurae]|uniref:Mitochondrial protein n=1 Tax=Paspalum notatum var. saurae TaxID=547442 RepID=A0AAQ3X0B9_PASNO
MDQTLYQSMIGLLLYLCASRPDIMFSVCWCAWFQANPKESHLSMVKRILRYLKHTLSIGLWYPKGTSFELLGYSALAHFVVVQEAELHILVHCGSGVYSGWVLLCPNSIYEANALTLRREAF